MKNKAIVSISISSALVATMIFLGQPLALAERGDQMRSSQPGSSNGSHGGIVNPSNRPTPNAPGNQMPGKGLVNPGQARGFNPQPDPPGKGAAGDMFHKGETQGILIGMHKGEAAGDLEPPPPGNEISLLHDAASGLPTGKRQHKHLANVKYE